MYLLANKGDGEAFQWHCSGWLIKPTSIWMMLVMIFQEKTAVSSYKYVDVNLK